MKSNKKGFTIVELVIVIAIIAILAAVLIPTFASLVKKANVSADTQLVRNLNMAVEIEKASSSAKHSTMHEALMTAQAAGYDVDTIVAKSGYNIAWDSANDRFVLVDKDAKKYIYPTSENTAENSISNPADYFLFCDDATNISEDNSGFSYYLSKNAKLPENGVVAVKAGFDAGENKNLKEVTYDGNATKVIFNLNGGKLTVTDTNASNQQYFYGFAAEAVVSTGNSCFHAYGTIAKLNLQAGTVVAKKNSILVVYAAENGSVKKEGGIVMAAAGKTFDQNSNVQISTSDEMNAFALEISDAAGLAAFRDSVNSGMTYAGLTVKLTADIDLSSQGNWNPIGNRYAKNGDTIVDAADNNPAVVYAFKGTFDGQGHTISGLFCYSLIDSYAGQRAKDNDNYSSSYAALFGNVDGATLKDFTVSGNVAGVDVAGIVGITGKSQTTIINVVSNVDLTGQQGKNDKNEVRAKVAGIVCCPKGNVTIKNCTNNGNIFAIDGPAGGIVAYIDVDITIENCTNNGTVNVNYVGSDDFGQAGGLIGVGNATCTVISCTNNGDVSSTTSTSTVHTLYVGEIIGKLNNKGTAVITKCTYNRGDGKYAVGNQKDGASSNKITITD